MADTADLAYQRAMNLEAAAMATYRAIQMGDTDTVTPPEYMEWIRRARGRRQGLRQDLMPLVAGLDFGGGAVKACVADVDRAEVLAVAQEPTETSFPAPGRAEFDPDAWWRAATVAMRAAVSQAARPPDDYGAVSVTSLRQGYVLLDDDGELGAGVVNADRRGADHLGQVRETIGRERLYEITGHWSAPQLTLPKLLEEQRSGRAGNEPGRCCSCTTGRYGGSAASASASPRWPLPDSCSTSIDERGPREVLEALGLDPSDAAAARRCRRPAWGGLRDR